MNGPYLYQIFAEAGIDILTINLLSKEIHQNYEYYRDEYLKSLSLRDKHLMFLDACQAGKIDYVKSLLPYVKPNINSDMALNFAIESNNLELVQILLQTNKFEIYDTDVFSAKGEILKYILDNYISEKRKKDMIKDYLSGKIEGHRYCKFELTDTVKDIINSMSFANKKKIMVFSEFFYYDDLLIYLLEKYCVKCDFDIFSREYRIVRLIIYRGKYELFKDIFDKIPINLHHNLILIIVSLVFNMDIGKILSYILEHGAMLISVNTYLENAIYQYTQRDIDNLPFIEILLQNDRLEYLDYDVLKVASKSSTELIDLFFNKYQHKINYSTIINEIIINNLIDNEHFEIARGILNREDVRIKKKNIQTFRKRKAVDEIDDEYIKNMVLDIKLYFSKKHRC